MSDVQKVAVIGCDGDTEEIAVNKPYNRFKVWKGTDCWHKDIAVQIRLEPDGSVFLSTQEGHVSTLRSGTISLECLHGVIKNIITTD